MLIPTRSPIENANESLCWTPFEPSCFSQQYSGSCLRWTRSRFWFPLRVAIVAIAERRRCKTILPYYCKQGKSAFYYSTSSLLTFLVTRVHTCCLLMSSMFGWHCGELRVVVAFFGYKVVKKTEIVKARAESKIHHTHKHTHPVCPEDHNSIPATVLPYLLHLHAFLCHPSLITWVVKRWPRITLTHVPSIKVVICQINT